MGFGDIHGRARVSSRNPEGFGVCDDCGRWFNYIDLVKQMEYFGPTLQWTGYLVCKRCNDTPQPQLRPVVLPPDPVPIVNPRPESFSIDLNLQGFTQYELDPNPPTTKAAVLAAIATLTGIPTPGGIIDRSGSIVRVNASQSLVPVNAVRSWLLIYGPAVPPLQFSLGAAVWGNPTNLSVGFGEALFWATAQGAGPVYTGAMTVIGLQAGVPFFAWEA